MKGHTNYIATSGFLDYKLHYMIEAGFSRNGCCRNALSTSWSKSSGGNAGRQSLANAAVNTMAEVHSELI